MDARSTNNPTAEYVDERNLRNRKRERESERKAARVGSGSEPKCPRTCFNILILCNKELEPLNLEAGGCMNSTMQGTERYGLR